MSFGSGSIPGYLQRLRNSKIRKANRQKKFKGENDYSKTKSIKTEYSFPKVSSYKLFQLKKKIEREASTKNEKQVVFWVSAIVVVIILLLLFNFMKF